MKRYDSVELNGILGSIEDWKKHDSTFRFGCYGIQKGYVRRPDLLRYLT